MKHLELYNSWLESEHINLETKEELKSLTDNKEIEDRFYRELEFGTGGLRGIIAAGTNRMNIYTVGKATQGFAIYLVNKFKEKASVAIAYDSRNMSKEFAKEAALVLAANGVKVYLFEDLRPTPMLSFTVRELKCTGGIVITASHNPKIYNGYKVYGADGGQVTDNDAKEILTCIEAVDSFEKVKHIEEETAINSGKLVYIGEEIDKTYYEKVKNLTIREELVKNEAENLNIIYTPIHGSGNIPVRRVLSELGYANVKVIKEQELPNGDFPTAPYPNPEDPKVFKLAIDMAKNENPDLIFGTDPDCDRIGVVVKDKENNYTVLSGNQTGILLTHYILSSLKELNKLPKNPVVIKTIVTTELVRDICKDFNVELLDVLTGFKYIGEKIKEFEETNSNNYLFGFEESFGYLAGTFVRDKDAVVAATLISEMALYYKSKNMSLYDALISIYEKYGYCGEELVSIELMGKEGQEKISKSLEYLRSANISEIAETNIVLSYDYKQSIEKNLLSNSEKTIELPKSNVLKYILCDDSWFVVRPSGTEPKMKIYLSCKAKNFALLNEKKAILKKEIMNLIEKSFEV